MFKFYLDNILVSNPINWSDFTETIERDDVIKGLLPKYEIKLKFNGSGYKYLYDTRSVYGFCKLVNLRVDENCGGNFENILEGYIFISDCKFNLNKCTVECSIEDDNYGARIFNNKSIKAFLGGVRSKNDVLITACSFSNVKLFTPTTGVFGVATRKVYDVKDAFRFLVDFMSDGLIGFESVYLSSIPELQYLKISTGMQIRTASEAHSPYFSFDELFNEINKRYPIGFTIITNPNGQKVIKIEEQNYFYNSTPSLSIENIQDMEESFDNEKLYSIVKFGGTAIDYDGSLTHFPQSRFFNFINEEYHFKTECNIDKTLDLTTEFICDSNIIEELYATNTSDDTYDDNVFLIETDAALKAKTYNDPITAGLPYYYNGELLNNKIAERYNLESGIAVYLGNNDDTFSAENTGFNIDLLAGWTPGPGGAINPSFPIETLLEFDNDNPLVDQTCYSAFDTNGNYNSSLNKYTSPFNGIYGFEVYVNASFLAGQTTNCIIGVRYKVYDSFDVLQNVYQPISSNIANTNSLGTLNYQGWFRSTFYLPAGFYVKAFFYMEALFMQISTAVYYGSSSVCQATSYFKTISVSNGGGAYTQSDPANYFVSKLEFDRPLAKADYDTLKQDLSKSLTVNHDGNQNKTAWIRKTIRKMATGEMKWELISNINNSQ